MAWGQIGRYIYLPLTMFGQLTNKVSISSDHELEIVLIALVQFIADSNSFIVGVTYNEVRLSTLG